MGKLPPLIADQVEGSLSQGMPTTLRHKDENEILLWGRPDDYIKLENGGTIPFDHKTRAGPPGDVHASHQLQMDTYTYLLQMNGFETVNKALLGFYYPDESDLHVGMRIHCKIIEVITDTNHVKTLMTKARDILSESMPESSSRCPYCNWLQSNSINRPIR